jgi:hypothetical protein
MIFGLALFPLQWMWIAAVLFAYFVVWITAHLVLYAVGVQRCRRWRLKDWAAARDVPGPGGIAPADVWHVVLLPNHTEPAPVLRRTLDALAAQVDAPERLVVVLAMEERESGSAAKGNTLAREYAAAFAHVLVTIHPDGLPGEVPVKAANLRWAARMARDELGRMGVASSLVTLTACDADSVVDPNYFTAVAELFARDERRHTRFWQAPLLYHNNMWRVPAPVRFTARLTQLYVLAELTLPGYDPLPISTYTMSLCLAEECDWWDPAVIAEDWHIYLDYMVQRRGEVSVVPVYLPVSLDSAEGDTWFSALRNRYVQLRRHAWGAADVGFLAGQLLSGKTDRSVWLRLGQVLHDHVLPVIGFSAAASLSLMPVLLRPPGALAILVTGLFTVSTVVIVTSMAIDVVRFPPGDRHFMWAALEIAKMWALLPVAGIAFGLLPALDAQTSLALGLPLEWKVTPKRLRLGVRPARESAAASAEGREL